MAYLEHNFPFYTVLFGDFLNASLSFSFSEDDVSILDKVVGCFVKLSLMDANNWIKDAEKKLTTGSVSPQGKILPWY